MIKPLRYQLLAGCFFMAMFASVSLFGQTGRDDGVIQSAATLEDFLDVIDTWRGTPYAAGKGDKNTGTDDGGFVAGIFREACALEFPADAQQLWNDSFGKRLSSESDDLLPGDVLFYNNHTGAIIRLAVYLGDEEDYEAVTVSPKTGVTAVHLKDIGLSLAGAKRFAAFNPGIRLRGSGYIAGAVSTEATLNDLLNEISGWIGTPYAWGNNKKQIGTDCSGFVTAVFRTVCGITLPRSSANMWSENVGEKIESRSGLAAGDVLFFRYGANIGHVAIYLGKNKSGVEEIVHAKNEKELLGVDPLKGYWLNQYAGAKRFALFKGSQGTSVKNDIVTATKSSASSAGKTTYRSSQENVNNVIIVKHDSNLLVTWNYKSGGREKQIARPVKDELFRKKFGRRVPDPVFYRYAYDWKGDNYIGTLIADAKGIVHFEVDHNLDEDAIEIYDYTLIASSSSSDQSVHTSGAAGKSGGKTADVFTQTGEASYYADKFHGRKTASGETFDMNAMTAAHKTLPFGTKVNVTNTANNKTVQVRINDRGPFVKGRIIDVSLAAAKALDMIRSGVADVIVEVVP